MGKAEKYKEKVRLYLESLGFSQTTDSIVEGTFEDMTFYNPMISPGKKFLIEAKATQSTLKSKKLAKELVKYYRLWNIQEKDEKFEFWLFMQGVKRKSDWKSMFSRSNDINFINDWCIWYNEKCREEKEPKLNNEDIKNITEFYALSTVKVANIIDLELAILEKRKTSIAHISRYGKKLLKILDKRKSPIKRKSKVIMNILPINLPRNYYVIGSTAKTKRQIYDSLEITAPPFIFNKKDKTMISFAYFEESNPLLEFSKGKILIENTKELLAKNPTFASQLVHIHLRRIVWNRGIYRDPKARIFYYPMLDVSKDARSETNYTGNKVWVTKKYVYQNDTDYANKGDINFFRHKAFELRTPTYWSESYIEIIPRKYYTLNGKDIIDGEIRAKIDARFRNPTWNRSKNKLQLIRFWKYRLFQSRDWAISPEPWFETFEFGDLLSDTVGWSPQVIGREQTRLWDFYGGEIM